MKLVSVETPEKSVCKMTFSASPEELEAASNAVYERTRATYTIKGFKKGEADRAQIEADRGEHTFWYDAINDLMDQDVPALYNAALAEHGYVPVDEPVYDLVSVKKDEGFVATATVALQPELIICSTAMSGYSTIESPAKAAGIPVIAVRYDDFSDYLKWFKVFCNLSGHPELWDSIAMKALDDVAEVLCEIPDGNAPRVLSMFANASTLEANTSSTVVGGMVSAMKAVNIVDSWDNTEGANRLTINLETVLAADPDIIIVQCHAGTDAAKVQVEETYGSNPVGSPLVRLKTGRYSILKNPFSTTSPTADLRRPISSWLRFSTRMPIFPSRAKNDVFNAL